MPPKANPTTTLPAYDELMAVQSAYKSEQKAIPFTATLLNDEKVAVPDGKKVASRECLASLAQRYPPEIGAARSGRWTHKTY